MQGFSRRVKHLSRDGAGELKEKVLQVTVVTDVGWLDWLEIDFIIVKYEEKKFLMTQIIVNMTTFFWKLFESGWHNV